MGGEDSCDIVDIEVSIRRSLGKEERRRALSAAASGRLIEVWPDPPIYVFMGEHGDHVIVDEVYCSCEAFMQSLARGRPGCYHVHATLVAPERVRRLGLTPSEAWTVVYEALATGFSSTLRRKLFVGD